MAGLSDQGQWWEVREERDRALMFRSSRTCSELLIYSEMGLLNDLEQENPTISSWM